MEKRVMVRAKTVGQCVAQGSQRPSAVRVARLNARRFAFSSVQGPEKDHFFARIRFYHGGFCACEA